MTRRSTWNDVLGTPWRLFPHTRGGGCMSWEEALGAICWEHSDVSFPRMYPPPLFPRPRARHPQLPQKRAETDGSSEHKDRTSCKRDLLTSKRDLLTFKKDLLTKIHTPTDTGQHGAQRQRLARSGGKGEKRKRKKSHGGWIWRELAPYAASGRGGWVGRGGAGSGGAEFVDYGTSTLRRCGA